jgi:ketosteroid isomerase-like protein
MTKAGESLLGDVEVVQAFYNAMERGDLEGMLAVVDSDAVLEEANSLPYAGVYRGHAAWRNLSAEFHAMWQDSVTTVDSIADAGPYVVSLIRWRAKSRHTGRTIEIPLAEFFWVVDGKITRLLPFYWDTAAVLRVIESE